MMRPDSLSDMTSDTMCRVSAKFSSTVSKPIDIISLIRSRPLVCLEEFQEVERLSIFYFEETTASAYALRLKYLTAAFIKSSFVTFPISLSYL